MKTTQLLYLSSLGIEATKRDVVSAAVTIEGLEGVADVDDVSSEDDNPEDG